MDFVCSLIKPDHTNHRISVPAESTIPNNSLGNFVMTSLSFQGGLFSVVLAAFVILKIPNLKVNPADQSAYYQNQTIQILDRISQQLASGNGQISTNYTPPSPYPTFHPSASNRRVNILWLISLVCSLSAALLATLVQQWARAYMRIFQQSRNPLKAARIHTTNFELVFFLSSRFIYL